MKVLNDLSSNRYTYIGLSMLSIQRSHSQKWRLLLQPSFSYSSRIYISMELSLVTILAHQICTWFNMFVCCLEVSVWISLLFISSTHLWWFLPYTTIYIFIYSQGAWCGAVHAQDCRRGSERRSQDWGVPVHVRPHVEIASWWWFTTTLCYCYSSYYCWCDV